MKLPTTPFKAPRFKVPNFRNLKFKGLKLQTIKPLQTPPSSPKESSGVRVSSPDKTATVTPEAVHPTAEHSKTSPNSHRKSKPQNQGSRRQDRRLPFLSNSKGSKLAFNLLLVRPWVLVVGFWLTSLLSAGLAWDGLISPRKLTMALPQPVSQPVNQADSFINIEKNDVELGAPAAGTAENSASETGVSASDGVAFPIWPLSIMVGTCAAGCLVMSRRRAMARMAVARSRHAARGESRGRVRKVRVNTVRKPAKAGTALSLSSSQPAGGQKPSTVLQSSPQSSNRAGGRGIVRPTKKRRQRNRRVNATSPANNQRPAIAKSRVLASRSIAQQAAVPNARTASARKGARKHLSYRVASRQAVVSVVPANESHALDWTNGSLAHQLDVRPRRSAM